MLSSHVKILPLLWLHNKSHRAFHTKKLLIKSEMVWYFIGVYAKVDLVQVITAVIDSKIYRLPTGV